jgi:integrase
MKAENYIDWNVKSVIKILDRNNYGYRVVLIYQDGTKLVQQKSGFLNKKEAENARMHTIGALTNGTYVVNNNVKIKEFLEYWLEQDIRQRVGSENTYTTYANIVHRHINPFIGKKKITELNQGDIQKLYRNRAKFSQHIARLVKTVLNTSMRYAVKKKLVSVNIAKGINLPKTVAVKPYHTKVIDAQKTLTMEQIQILLEASKDTPIHMQVLFNVLMGLRRQEINGVKYSDVDYINRTLTVERQLGKKLIRNPDENNGKGTTKQELSLKTSSSYRMYQFLIMSLRQY